MNTITSNELREYAEVVRDDRRMDIAERLDEFADAWEADITDGHLKDERITALELALRLSEARVEALEKALRWVEKHHVELNAKAGRPESHSHTLEVVRAALAEEKP